jgi:hypothetical protein
MQRGLIHWRLLPSGRRVICQSSLSSSRHKGAHQEIPIIGFKEPPANGHTRS